MSAGQVADLEPPVRRPPYRRWLARNLLRISILLAVLALLVVFLWNRIFVSIHPGHAGVVYRLFSGTETERVYDTGLHILPPWDTMHRYEVRKQLTMDDFDVLSVRGLTINIQLAIRYQPRYEQLGQLHQGIGPDYVERVVKPQVQSVMRQELSRYTAEQIYTNDGNLLNEAVKQARDEVGRNFVEAYDIIIRSVSLPDPVRQAIEDKLKQRELLLSYNFRLRTATEEAERKRDEARGIRDYQAKIGSSLNERLLQHAGISATRDLAVSRNARVIMLGGDGSGLPLVPGGR